MQISRPALNALAESRSIRHFLEHSSLGRRLSSRFVAGASIEDALGAVRSLHREGILAALDHLGENVKSAVEARRASAVYHQLLAAVDRQRLSANVSLKLTQMGIDLQPELAFELTGALVRQAAALGGFVRVDMESSRYTDATLDLVRRIHGVPENRGCVGVVIQACLYRSEADVAALIDRGISVRLCKGAYKEPSSLAFPRKRDVDKNFIRLMRLLLKSDLPHAIATHDPRMIAATREFAQTHGLRGFEFEMLYGIRHDLQQSLVAEGYRMRVYVPFGTDWYPYFMRRLAERPANVLFIASQLFRR